MADRKFVSENKFVLQYPDLTSEEESLINKSKPESQNKKENPKTPIAPKKTFTYKKSVSALSKLFSSSKKTKRKYSSNLSKNLRRNFSLPKKNLRPLSRRAKRRVSPSNFQSGFGSNENLPSTLQEFQRGKQAQLNSEIQRQKQLSPNTQAMLERLWKIQNKSKLDDARQQRLRREREIVGKAGSLLATPFIFKDVSIDPTQEIPELNPLRAPNVFKEDPVNNPHILTPRPNNILNSKFRLKF